MPWYLSVVSADGTPLGTRDGVVARLNPALPGLRWAQGPSSFDELVSIPNHPLLQLPWTEEQRAVFSLPFASRFSGRQQDPPAPARFC